MKDEVIKQYCGLLLVRLAIDELGIGGTYVVYNRYEDKVKASGSLKECEKYFDRYINRITNRN